jgi:hypothetical protein
VPSSAAAGARDGFYVIEMRRAFGGRRRGAPPAEHATTVTVRRLAKGARRARSATSTRDASTPHLGTERTISLAAPRAHARGYAAPGGPRGAPVTAGHAIELRCERRPARAARNPRPSRPTRRRRRARDDTRTPPADDAAAVEEARAIKEYD